MESRPLGQARQVTLFRIGRNQNQWVTDELRACVAGSG